MKEHIFVFAGFLVLSIGGVNAANILAVFPMNTKSHMIVHMSIIKALLERDHNITLITTLPVEDKSPNLHSIYIPTSGRRIEQVAKKKSKMVNARSKYQMMFSSMNVVLAMGPTQLEVLKHRSFQDFMNNPHNQFDLLVIGYFFNDYLFGIGAHFNCPIVMSWTGSTNIFVGRYIGTPLELAYAPSSPMMGQSDPLKFTGRLSKFVTSLATSVIIAVLHMQMSILYNELFPAPKYPSMEDAGKRVSLLLCNSHFSEGNIRPNVPAYIEIGGIQIKEKPDPLPKDLKRILDGANEHGVIYISLGSNIGFDELKPETVRHIYRVLSSVQQTVLWKWESKPLPGRASNIHYREWFPQSDLLAHPNVKLFITHAGKGSVSESQYHGVPMVAIPIFADQPGNADQLTSDGFGVQLDVFTITEDTVRSAILEVLQNSSYRENVQNFSDLYRDRPMTARQSAVYWIEYVIRRKGAYHMQSPLVHLNSLQSMCVDVLGFLFAVIFITLKVVQIVLRSFRLFIRKNVCWRSRKIKRK